MFRRVGAVLLALSALLVGTALPAPAVSTSTVYGWTTTSASGAVGYTIRDAVSIRTGSRYVARNVRIQRRSYSSSTWTTLSYATSSSTGAYTAAYSVPATGTWYFRLYLPATSTAAATTTAARRVTGVTGQSTAVSGWTTTTTDVAVGSTTRVAVRVRTGTAYVTRSLAVQRRLSSTSTWTTLVWGTTTSTGSYTAALPTSSAGTWYFRVVVLASASAASSTTASRALVAYPRPTVTGLSPSSGLITGGTSVLLSGTGLSKASRVVFGATPAPSVTVLSATQVRVTAPAAATPGDVTVLVTTPGGTSPVTPGARFTYGTPPDTTAPGPVTAVSAQVTDASVALSWTNPRDPDLTGVVVRRALGTTAPADISAGVLVASTTGAVTTAVDATVQRGQTYTYALFAHDGVGNIATPAVLTVVSAPLPDTTSPTEVTGLTAQPVGATAADLTWADPTNSDVAEIVVLRRAGSRAPTGPDDAQLSTTVPPGTGHWRDAGLAAAGTYSYSVFARDAAGNASRVRTVTVSTLTAEGCDATPMSVPSTITVDTTLSPSCGRVWLLDGTTTVTSPATLTIGPGVVLKGTSGARLVVGNGARLTSRTDTGSPVIMTSDKDDSVGGDTNRDGGDALAFPGSWAGIQVEPGGAIDLAGPTIDFATAVSAHNPSSFDVRRATLDDGTTISVYDEDGTSSDITIAENTLRHVGVTTAAISVASYSSSPSPLAPTVRDNDVSGVRTGPYSDPMSTPIRVQASRILPGQLMGNHGSDNDANTIEVGGRLSDDLSLPQPGLEWMVYDILTIPAGTNLTLQEGTTLRLTGAVGALDVGGSLTALGTSESPVTIMHVLDDFRGDFTHDGPPANDVRGLWSGIWATGTPYNSPVVSLDHVVIRDAATAIAVQGPAQVHVSGEIGLTNMRGIRTDGSTVIARNVDWGSPSGPRPLGPDGTTVEGSVAVVPWVGYITPPPPEPVADGTTSAATDRCKDVMFLGVRGSDEAPRNTDADSAYASWDDGMGDKVTPVYQAFAGWMGANTTKTWKGIGLRYPAMAVPDTSDLSNVWLIPAYQRSIYAGVDRIQQYLRDEIAACPDQHYVLSGYSQGALAVHLYLRARADADTLSRVDSVVLVADPDRQTLGQERLYMNDLVSATLGMQWSEGVYAGLGAQDSGPLPSAITARTYSICRDHDLVCSFTLGSSKDPHSTYSSSELTQLGQWAAIDASSH